MSLNIHDKLINHFMTRYVLEPKLTKYLDNRNIATRVGLGCDYGIKLIKKYINKMKKYNNFYILKLDIKKYFYNINHDKLKEMIKRAKAKEKELKKEIEEEIEDIDRDDEDDEIVIMRLIKENEDYSFENDLNNIEYKIICNIIDSTNEDYINKIINKLGKDLPLYQKGRGLPIGYENQSIFINILFITIRSFYYS